MSKTSPLFLFLFLVFIWGCSPSKKASSPWFQENGKIKILTTISMINDVVSFVGGDEVNSMALIQGALDPHSYELVKGDEEKFRRADLIFFNGLGLEHGLSLRQYLENNPQAVAVAEPLRNKPGSILEIDGTIDPHVWMDVALWMHIIDPIVETLSQRDPQHAPRYRERGSLLRTKMEEADAAIFALLQSVDASKRYLVTSHDAFHYFARHYLAIPGEEEWYIRCRAPEGLAPEAQLSVSDIMAIMSHIETFQIPVLFPESNLSKDALRKILDAGRQKKLNIRLCQEVLYGDSMGNASSYLEMMMHNAQVIQRELAYE